MKINYWVKFEGEPPILWSHETFMDFWRNISQAIVNSKKRGPVEWVIRD